MNDKNEFVEQIVRCIRARNNSGETYERMHEKTGIAASHIHRIANRRQDPLKMSLEKFLALFPCAQIQLDPPLETRVPDDPAACCVPLSDYQDLRDRYQDLRDRYQDLREQLIDLKSRPPLVLDGEGPAPYHVPILSGSNK